MKDYELVYEEFWKSILEKDGDLDIDQMKRELFDFHNAIDSVEKVYDHITSGNISKITTSHKVVIQHADESYQKLHEEELELTASQKQLVRELCKRVDQVSNFRTAIECMNQEDDPPLKDIRELQECLEYQEDKLAELKEQLGLNDGE